ncbi:MAG: c-type cytochrome, partial [Verrucomicrobia bacterium]|nr:c-type cytochrome [Verrucomicrobiota bacterium]
CYRHLQFPLRYQNGLFLLDWTFGKVWFTPLIPSDATYQTDPSIFLEATGRSGFAPTDAAVAPDGSLLISCGGRKTRGVIYRIRYIMDPARLDLARNWKDDAANEVVLALQAPQPTDAWSRAIWGPAAVKLTSRPFDLAAISEELPDSMRIRAVEILTEAHGGLMTVTAEAGSQMASPFLRARIAWSLGRIPCAGFSPIVARLARDGSAMVRRCALEAAFEQMEGMKIEDLLQCSMVNAGHPDRRIRQLAASIAVSLPLEHWKTFFTTLATASPSAQLGAAWAAAMRFPTNGFNSALAGLALRPFRQATQPADRLEALGLMMMALGDWDLENPGVELYTSYSAAHLPAPADPVRGSMAQAALTALGTGDSMLAWEGARLLAMLQSRDTNAPARLLSQITPGTPAPSDFHYLIALSRLPSTISPDTTRRTAQALIGLSRKLNGLQNRPKQTWNDRASELYAQLFRRDAALATQLASHADFNRLDLAPIALAMDSTNRMICARRFLAQAIGDASLRWTSDLVRLFESLPARETQAALRAQWKQVELRDELLLALARDPQAIDRDKFVLGLDSLHSAVCIASLHSLLVVPPDPKNLAPSVAAVSRLLRRSVQNPSLAIRPPQVVSLLNRLTGQSFRLPEETSDALALEQSTRPVFEWLGKNHPQQGSNLRATGDRDAQWETLLRSVDWNRGNATAGESIYNTRGCALCHGGAANLGPDLTGSTKRWSPADLFQQIRYPNLLVPEAYRVHRIRTRDGRAFLGVPAYFSAETLLLKLADGQTLRLDQADIVSQEPGTDSPMPDNLMDGMTAQSLADLYAFMKQLDAAVE